MTVKERNDQIRNAVNDLLDVHSQFTGAKILTDADWKFYIDTMENLTAEHAKTSIWVAVRKISQVLLDDTEDVQNRLKEHAKTKKD